LKVGIIEEGRVTRSQVGAPQGAVISPILANAYLHYVYDLWVQRWRRTGATGDMIVVRFADDQIVGFEHEHEAKAFLHYLHERLRAFELALHPEKTRLIRFGRHAAKQRASLGPREGPECRPGATRSRGNGKRGQWPRQLIPAISFTEQSRGLAQASMSQPTSEAHPARLKTPDHSGQAA
jgi:hypothetical protein